VTYAASTDVSTGRTRDEIERTLAKYGASRFAYAWEPELAMVGFVANGRQVRFLLPLPDRDRAEFRLTPTSRKPRSATQWQEAYEQAIRSRWRQLLLVIKAKLQAVESGIVSFEAEFGMHMVLPDGRTVAEHVLPGIAQAYATGEVPALLGPIRPQLEGRP
jgi:hypothetical protein